MRIDQGCHGNTREREALHSSVKKRNTTAIVKTRDATIFSIKTEPFRTRLTVQYHFFHNTRLFI